MAAKSGSFWKNVDVGTLNLSVRIVQQINILLIGEYVYLPRNESCQIYPTIQWGNLEIVWKFWNYRWKKQVVLGGAGLACRQPQFSGEKRRNFDYSSFSRPVLE